MTRPLVWAMPITVAVASVWACASASPRPFDQLIAQHRWADAAHAFADDSTLMNDPGALYSAGVLFGSPSRPTYDPERARTLVQGLLTRFPDSKYAVDAADRLSLLEEALRARSGASRVRELEARIADLTSQQQRLRAELDSTQLQNDVLRRSATRLEEQLRALRLELRQLKEIDLKPRPPGVRPLLRE